jgi:hypothetical protein
LGAIPSAQEVISALTRKMKRREELSDSEIALLRHAGVRLSKSYVTQREFISSARWHAARFERLVGIEAGVFISNLADPWIIYSPDEEIDNVEGLDSDPFE